MSQHSDLPLNSDDWTKDHVRQWITQDLKIDGNFGEILYNQDVTGAFLKSMKRDDLVTMGITFGPAHYITEKFTELNNKPMQNTTLPARQNLSDTHKGESQGEVNQNQRKVKQCKSHKVKSVKAQVSKGTIDNADSQENISNKVEMQASVSKSCSEDELPRPTCMAYPFDVFNDCKRYTEHHMLTPESGPLNLIDPVHEFKSFTNTDNATGEDIKVKFCNETFRFAAACMNSRTNGTIHFGVNDKPHGEIVGLEINRKELFIDWFYQMIKQYFKLEQLNKANDCIRPPRFVEVLNVNNTPSDRYVIEVDVIPKYSICNGEIFSTYQQNLTESKSQSKQEFRKSKDVFIFVRDGASSKDLLANIRQSDSDHKRYVTNLKLLDERRHTAEEIERSRKQKKLVEGPKLISLITGNRDTLDNSYYKWYILVTNKCHANQLPYLDFLKEIQWFAVFEYDPESEKNGTCKSYREERVANLHFPCQFQDEDDTIADKIEKLKLYQQTSWIFCNGRTDLVSEAYEPLAPSLWRKKQAAEVKKLISFFSRKDMMQRGRFLVVFLLLSIVEDPADPITLTFQTFYEELNGMEEIVCICESEETGKRWKDLQSTYVDIEEMAERCISNLSLEEVNGTIVKLKSIKKSFNRFLPSSGSSSTVLQRKEEDLMSGLEILCENECERTKIENNRSQFIKFKITQEENFYRGGKVSWCHFYFSSKHHSGPFIQRDSYECLQELIMSWSQSEKQMCVKIITLYHHPGCGGTTLCMHLLWNLKKKFRCVVLKNKTADFTDIGRQITHLATYGFNKPSDYFPVLLLVDDFEEEENVIILQNSIQTAVAKKCIRYEKPVVIILNCMRSQNPEDSSKSYITNSVALTYVLSSQEQRAFADKLKEIELAHECPENFYSFMIMKSNFDIEYIKKVVRNTLKGLNKANKSAQLISYLALLNSFVKDSTMSVSQCEEFLEITRRKYFWGNESVESKMGRYFSILICIEVEEYGGYQGLRILHPLIANQCLEELKLTYHLNKSTIMLQLLDTECVFHKLEIGRDKFLQNIQSMLVTRQQKEYGDDADTLFSPLIEKIQEEEGNSEAEHVLVEGTNVFQQNPFIFQALARHFYIRERNFEKAVECAKKAKEIAPDNSFLSDTLGKIFKSKLKVWLDENAKKKTITSQELHSLLHIASSASKAFEECQAQSAKKGNVREEWSNQKHKKRLEVYNTAGFLGQIETCLYAVDLLKLAPCFNKNVLLKHLVQYLPGNYETARSMNQGVDDEFIVVLKEYEYYLTNLKGNLKKAFDFFNDYFVHLKPRNILKETAEIKIRKKVSYCFHKYTQQFFDRSVIDSRPIKKQLSVTLQSEQFRTVLEVWKADTFSGLLEYLYGCEEEKTKMEEIVKKYEFLLEKNKEMSISDKQNFIMANIVLSCINPKSNHICAIETLKECLREVLCQVGLDYTFSEPYFLASLLFWPPKQNQLDEDSVQMEKYVSSMKRSFGKQYGHMCMSKQPVAHFYLGKSGKKKRKKELGRFIPKGKIDQLFSTLPPQDLYSLWQTGDIWRKKDLEKHLLRLTGRTEGDLVFVECGSENKIKIPARPVYLGQHRRGRSIEKVSFYLGFSIEGLIAYNIESA